MSNEYYNPTGNPATNSAGASAPMRAEFTNISTAFTLLPVMGGHANCAVVVNGGGSALTTTSGQLALAGNFSTTGAFSTILAQAASVTLTLPGVSGTLATLAGTETLVNKTLTSPTMTGVPIAPTPSLGDNTTKVATTAFVTTAVATETTRATTAEALLAPKISPSFTGTPVAPTPSLGTNNTQLATTAFVAGTVGAAGTIPGGLITGYTLSSATTTTLGIATGRATDSANTIVIVLNSAFTKSITASWTAGTANGGMGTGLTATASTWYHVFAIVVSAATDIYFDTSPSGANAPGGTTAKRYIGSFFLNSSTQIRPFIQYGDHFDWATPTPVLNGVIGTSPVTLALDAPLGIATEAILSGFFYNVAGSGDSLLINSLSQTDQTGLGIVGSYAGPVTCFTEFAASWDTRVFTDTNSSIRIRSTSSFNDITLNVSGWVDSRGK